MTLKPHYLPHHPRLCSTCLQRKLVMMFVAASVTSRRFHMARTRKKPSISKTPGCYRNHFCDMVAHTTFRTNGIFSAGSTLTNAKLTIRLCRCLLLAIFILTTIIVIFCYEVVTVVLLVIIIVVVTIICIYCYYCCCYHYCYD